MSVINVISREHDNCFHNQDHWYYHDNEELDDCYFLEYGKHYNCYYPDNDEHDNCYHTQDNCYHRDNEDLDNC